MRPCVALLHATPDDAAAPSADEALIPRLDAKEVAAVFSAPLHNFLLAHDEVPAAAAVGADDGAPPPLPLPAGQWYEGSWTRWHESSWRMHFFYVPVHDQVVARPRVRAGGLAALAEHGDDDDDEPAGRFKVWGMTARMIVDAATVAYGEAPRFEHNSHFGDERIIEGLEKMGRLGEKKKPGSVLTADDLKEASKM